METNEIILACKRTIENNPDYDAMCYNRTSAFFCNGNTHGALLDYRKALENGPDTAMVFMNNGLIKAGFEDYRGAIGDR
jgi:hypothetical protein